MYSFKYIKIVWFVQKFVLCESDKCISKKSLLRMFDCLDGINGSNDLINFEKMLYKNSQNYKLKRDIGV